MPYENNKRTFLKSAILAANFVLIEVMHQNSIEFNQ